MNEQQVRVLNALIRTYLTDTSLENVYSGGYPDDIDAAVVECRTDDLPEIFKEYLSKENIELIEERKTWCFM